MLRPFTTEFRGGIRIPVYPAQEVVSAVLAVCLVQGVWSGFSRANSLKDWLLLLTLAATLQVNLCFMLKVFDFTLMRCTDYALMRCTRANWMRRLRIAVVTRSYELAWDFCGTCSGSVLQRAWWCDDEFATDVACEPCQRL